MLKSCQSDLNAIVDLWNAQVSFYPDWMAREGGTLHPRMQNPALTNIMKDYDLQEKERRDARVLQQSGVSLIDGEQYSLDQHRQVCEYGLTGDGIQRAARSSEYRDAMTRLFHLCGDEYLQRSEGRALTHLRDAHMYCADAAEGDQPMHLLVHHEDRSKTNRGALLVRHGAARQRNDPITDLSFHFGIFLFVRFVVKGYVPTNWSNRQQVTNWLEELIFHPAKDRTAKMTNRTANELLNRAYLKSDPPIKHYHISHLSRKTKSKRADLAGVSDEQQRRQGVWNLEDAKNRSYTTNLPMQFIRWSSGHGFDRGNYHVPRASVEPSDDLVLRVFPFVENMKAQNNIQYSQWLQEAIELLGYLGKVLLQDVAVLQGEIQHSILTHDPFCHEDFEEFREASLAAIASDTSHDPVTFKSPAMEIREAENRINKKISDVASDILEAVSGAARPMGIQAVGGRIVAPAARILQAAEAITVQPAPVTPVALRQRAPQSPYDTSTWRPRQIELPDFAKNYVPDKPTTIQALIKEYAEGTRRRPPLRLIEKYFGPGRRRGRLPSWRSQATRKTRKYDSQYCKQKKIYDKIDDGMSADDFLDVVRQENDSLFGSDGEYLINGKLVTWLISYYTKQHDGYARNKMQADRRNAKRKENRNSTSRSQDEEEDSDYSDFEIEISNNATEDV